MIATIRSMRWTISTAIIVGMLLSGVFTDAIRAAYQDFYNRQFPVVTMRGKLVSQDSASATIHITGTKNRDCKFVGLLAYTSQNGSLTDAFKERVTGPKEDGTSKPKGTYDIGYWRIWPKQGADSVLMYVQHDCAGPHLTTTKIADVAL
jgi:hypothetical protein